jgi:hypothetical protein
MIKATMPLLPYPWESGTALKSIGDTDKRAIPEKGVK